MSEDRNETTEKNRHELAGASTAAERVIQSKELFGDRNDVLIRHKAETYRLRITRNGKLILYK